MTEEGSEMMSPWAYPENRYYYEWYADASTDERSDSDIKQDLLDQIRTGPYEDQYDIDVDVTKGVVILTGTATTTVAKRAAGDDAWDTRGVTDVSNQIQVKREAGAA
jgi:osmotically-inducible protein OsmY